MNLLSKVGSSLVNQVVIFSTALALSMSILWGSAESEPMAGALTGVSIGSNIPVTEFTVSQEAITTTLSSVAASVDNMNIGVIDDIVPNMEDATDRALIEEDVAAQQAIEDSIAYQIEVEYEKELERIRLEEERKAEEESRRKAEEERKKAEEKRRKEEEAKKAEEKKNADRKNYISTIVCDPTNVSLVTGLKAEDYKYLTQGTWWEGNEQTLIDLEATYSVNAAFCIAVSSLESGNGTSYLAKNKHNYYGMVKTTYWNGLYDCTQYWGNLISSNYVSKNGLHSVYQIGPVYCPPNREWETWVSNKMSTLYTSLISRLNDTVY